MRDQGIKVTAKTGIKVDPLIGGGSRDQGIKVIAKTGIKVDPLIGGGSRDQGGSLDPLDPGSRIKGSSPPHTPLYIRTGRDVIPPYLTVLSRDQLRMVLGFVPHPKHHPRVPSLRATQGPSGPFTDPRIQHQKQKPTNDTKGHEA